MKKILIIISVFLIFVGTLVSLTFYSQSDAESLGISHYEEVLVLDNATIRQQLVSYDVVQNVTRTSMITSIMQYDDSTVRELVLSDSSPFQKKILLNNTGISVNIGDQMELSGVVVKPVCSIYVSANGTNYTVFDAMLKNRFFFAVETNPDCNETKAVITGWNIRSQ